MTSVLQTRIFLKEFQNFKFVFLVNITNGLSVFQTWIFSKGFVNEFQNFPFGLFKNISKGLCVSNGDLFKRISEGILGIQTRMVIENISRGWSSHQHLNV